MEEASRRGLPVRLVAPSSLSWSVSSRALGFCGEKSPQFIFTRLGSSASEQDLMIVRAAEAAGIPILNSFAALRRCRDKAQTYLCLRSAGVPVPDTLCLGSAWSRELVEKHCGPPPHIVKLSQGTQGQGVMLSESWRSLTSLLEAMRAMGGQVLVQRFLSESQGRDTRVLVVGGVARGAALRQAQDSTEFRSNLHLGGLATVVEPSSRQVAVAEAAVASLGLEVAGVDLLETLDGPVVVEVNGSPGYEASPFFVKHIWDYLQVKCLGGEAFLETNRSGHDKGS